MPTVGLEYRYPFINVQSWGTQTIEPIAQVIVRPNETGIGKLPNEDSQSLIFDDTNLFQVDKFAGWDRVEGGGRANVGVQYTTQFNRGGFVNAMFGQSYQLFGTNSFAAGDTTNTGLDSGLDTDRSDYVARLLYQPDRIWSFTTRFRFDQDDVRGAALRDRSPRQLRPLVGCGALRQLRRPAAARLPGAARGHSRQRLDQAHAELAWRPPRSATTSTRTSSPAPRSASATSTIASLSP